MPELFWLIASGCALAAGLVCVLIGVLGVYRFRYVLNRMHAASMLDTLGMFCILLSLILAVRSAAYLPKLILVLLMLWVGSPIASHLVSRMEYRTGKDAGQHFWKEDRS